MLDFEPVVQAYVAWSIRRHGRLTVDAMQTIWPLVVGRAWAQRTRPEHLVRGRLEVAVVDGVWLSELRYQRERIVSRLNRLLPSETAQVTELRLRVGEVGATHVPRAVGEREGGRIPLTAGQREGLDRIDDPGLKSLIGRIVERDMGRSSNVDMADDEAVDGEEQE